MNLKGYTKFDFDPEKWRINPGARPAEPVLVLKNKKGYYQNILENTLVFMPSGAGRTAFFLMPQIETALASGASVVMTDPHGDSARYFSSIAKKYYDYTIKVINLLNVKLDMICGNDIDMDHLISEKTIVFITFDDCLSESVRWNCLYLLKRLVNGIYGSKQYNINGKKILFVLDEADSLPCVSTLYIDTYVTDYPRVSFITISQGMSFWILQGKRSADEIINNTRFIIIGPQSACGNAAEFFSKTFFGGGISGLTLQLLDKGECAVLDRKRPSNLVMTQYDLYYKNWPPKKD